MSRGRRMVVTIETSDLIHTTHMNELSFVFSSLPSFNLRSWQLCLPLFFFSFFHSCCLICPGRGSSFCLRPTSGPLRLFLEHYSLYFQSSRFFVARHPLALSGSNTDWLDVRLHIGQLSFLNRQVNQTFITFALLAAGSLAVALSIIWRAPNPLRNFVISEMDLNSGLVLGILLIATWIVSIGGILQPNHVTIGLSITNGMLLLDSLAVTVIGCMVWFYTLTPTKNFFQTWTDASPDTRQMIQETLKCCGFRNSTESTVYTGFCADTAFAASQAGCSVQILPFADYTLNNIFSSIFGFMGIVVCFFLATLCIINKRNERERFRRIDAKRGGRGFV